MDEKNISKKQNRPVTNRERQGMLVIHVDGLERLDKLLHTD